MKVTTDHDITLCIDTGATMKILAGIPKEIPTQFQQAALKAGLKDSTTTTSADIEEAGAALETALADAVKLIIERGDPDDFDKKGNIKLTVLKATTGLNVTAAMRDALME